MSKRAYFGTDGIRGEANRHPMTAEVALRVGLAAGKLFRRDPDRRHLVVIGKDTRLSGYMIEPALTAGFASVGMDVRLFGPLPTPAVAMMTRTMRADLGVMISASHNTFSDNGIKLFGPDGYKLSDARELEIEALMDEPLQQNLAEPTGLGRVQRVDDAPGPLCGDRQGDLPPPPQPRRVEGGDRLRQRGRLQGRADRPIRTGGGGVSDRRDARWHQHQRRVRLHLPKTMSAAVRQYRADIGIALDGDADRLVICDERGTVIDGDQIMAIIAKAWTEAHRLQGGGVVATVMSNLGLERYLGGLGLTLERTQVGDRYVVERMREGRFNLGGEASGHVVLSDFSTTGDGLIAALQVLAVKIATGAPVSALARQFEPVPQKLENVRFSGGEPLKAKSVRDMIADAEARLSGSGRILVRASGTEPLIRVMAEGDDETLVSQVVKDIAGAVRAAAA